MLRALRSSLALQATVYFAVALLLLAAWPQLAGNLFSTNGQYGSFMPHQACYQYTTALWVLHVVSDFSIGLSYVVISATLAYFVLSARREIPFSWIFLAFGAFIIACGCTHFMEVYTTWVPRFWLSGYLKLITAAVSVATAALLPPLIPRAHALLRSARTSEETKLQLEAANAELRTANQRIQELDELRSQFFANASHELRTPLTLILGPTRKLLAEGALRDDQLQALQMVERNARGLLTQVNDLLDVAKLEAGQMGMHYAHDDLAHLVRISAGNFDSMAVEQSIDFNVIAPARVPIEADSDKLRLVLVNLLANSFKFTPAGGSITVQVETSPNAVELKVGDSGPGVAAGEREHIFDRYQQGLNAGRVSGTGLGLAIAREFIDLHRGSIRVGDSPHGGAEFTVRIPLKAPEGTSISAGNSNVPDEITPQRAAFSRHLAVDSGPAMNAQGRAANAQGRPEQPLVLVVEDNPDMLTFVHSALTRDNRVISAGDGQAGLEAAIAQRPDLIVSDMMMPRMSGDEMVRQIRMRPELIAIPIVILTAKTDDLLRVRLLQGLAQDYVMKPFDEEELRARVANLVSVKRARELLQVEVDTRDSSLNELVEEVTLRKREAETALEALRASEERARELVQSNIIGITVGDQIGHILEANDAFLTMVGRTRAELESGQIFWPDITPPEFAQLDKIAVAEILEHGSCAPYEKEYLRSDGSRVPVMLGASALPGAAREYICYVLDITERRQAERERERLLVSEQTARREAEAANHAKDEFLAVLSHELRTPLNSILGWAHLLRTENLAEETVARALETIERSARTQTQLVEDLLDVSRIITGKLMLQIRTIDLPAVVSHALNSVRPVAGAKRIPLQTNIDPDMRPVPADAHRIEQVVWNLLANAIKFSPEGSPVELRLEQHESHARIVVRDHGAGIKAELLPFIFQRFRQGDSSSTRTYGGLGLGLSIVRHLVEMHGGTVYAQSEGEGRGAIFTVTLPQLWNMEEDGRAAEGPSTEAMQHSAQPLSGIRVLLVDDQPDTLEVLAAILERAGARVESCLSAAAALDAISNHVPDVLVSDIAMPEQNGYELMERIRTLARNHGGSIPAIALTAHAGAKNREQSLAVGFQKHLTKPVSPTELIAAIGELLGR